MADRKRGLPGDGRRVGSGYAAERSHQARGKADRTISGRSISGFGVSRRRQQRRVGDLYQIASAETVEAGAQAGPIGAELTKLNPIAFAHVAGQPERPLHAVGAVAGRSEQREIGERLGRVVDLAETNAARREAEAQRASVAKAAIDPVIDKERAAAAQLDLHDDRPA